MRGFGVTSVSFAVETHMNRSPRSSGSIRSRSGSRTRTGSATRRRTASSTPTRRRCRRSTPSPTRSATSSRPTTAAMTRDASRGRSAARAPARAGRRPGGTTDGQAQGPGLLGDRVPDGHEPERRPVAGVDQDQARRPRRRLLGHVRHRQRLEDDPERRSSPRRSACPYDWITYDNSNTDSSPLCTGTFASRATFVAGKAVERPRSRRARSCSRSPARSSRSTRPTSTSSTAR